MRLLSLTLDGQYKGLKNQVFDFSETSGNIIALIGLNGSGKSQLLELISETFAYLERWQRPEFGIKTGLGFAVSIVYECSLKDDRDCALYHDELFANDHVRIRVKINIERQVTLEVFKSGTWLALPNEKSFPLPWVIGYSSGQNENLQRSFMKNSVKYFNVMNTRLKRRKDLTAELDEVQIANINKGYISRYPKIFKPAEGEAFEQDGYLSIQESDTPVSRMVYLDYDSAGLVLASLAVLKKQEITSLLKEVRFKYPIKIVMQYDFKSGVAEEDAIKDVELLCRIAGSDNVIGLGRTTTDKQKEIYGLDYLSGQITLNLTNDSVASDLRDTNYNDPVTLFRRLYKLQQLGIKNWQAATRMQLSKDNFLGTVKKPLKTKLPLSIFQLELADENGVHVNSDGLSDGEAQLIQVLATAKIFSNERALFLLDEPETHLNPSWRTYFHNHLSAALANPELTSPQTQVFLSTHSPFMVSSLKREDVIFFERDQHGLIKISPVASQTYGASFEVLIKKHFGLRSLISQTVVEAVKNKLPSDELPESIQVAREWVEANLGDSMEKAYLLRKLQD